jgi:hypothetical protein
MTSKVGNGGCRDTMDVVAQNLPVMLRSPVKPLIGTKVNCKSTDKDLLCGIYSVMSIVDDWASRVARTQMAKSF